MRIIRNKNGIVCARQPRFNQNFLKCNLYRKSQIRHMIGVTSYIEI